jgi:tetratricopeptide (TPR) repeat protein
MRVAALLVLLFGAPFASAGIFSPNEPCPFEIAPDGTAKPLPLNVFKLLLNERVAALNPATPDIQTFKGIVTNRLKDAPKAPSRAQMVGISADLLRVGRDREVIELLTPTIRDDNPDYRLMMHLARAHAALGDWDLALKRTSDARDCDPPAELAGTKPEQLKWMLKVDRAYTRPWMLAARGSADPKSRPNDPDVPPIFRDATPADAIAVVQQLVLWAPLDANLLWLLGSLHLEKGQFAEAFDILEQCRERKLTWPKFRVQHAAAEAGYMKLPKVDPFAGTEGPKIDLPEEPQPKRGLFDVVAPEQFAIVVAGFGVMVLALLALQIRKFRNRRRPG